MLEKKPSERVGRGQDPHAHTQIHLNHQTHQYLSNVVVVVVVGLTQDVVIKSTIVNSFGETNDRVIVAKAV